MKSCPAFVVGDDITIRCVGPDNPFTTDGEKTIRFFGLFPKGKYRAQLRDLERRAEWFPIKQPVVAESTRPYLDFQFRLSIAEGGSYPDFSRLSLMMLLTGAEANACEGAVLSPPLGPIPVFYRKINPFRWDGRFFAKNCTNARLDSSSCDPSIVPRDDTTPVVLTLHGNFPSTDPTKYSVNIVDEADRAFWTVDSTPQTVTATTMTVKATAGQGINSATTGTLSITIEYQSTTLCLMSVNDPILSQVNYASRA